MGSYERLSLCACHLPSAPSIQSSDGVGRYGLLPTHLKPFPSFTSSNCVMPANMFVISEVLALFQVERSSFLTILHTEKAFSMFVTLETSQQLTLISLRLRQLSSM